MGYKKLTRRVLNRDEGMYLWGWWNGYKKATGRNPSEAQIGRVLKKMNGKKF